MKTPPRNTGHSISSPQSMAPRELSPIYASERRVSNGCRRDAVSSGDVVREVLAGQGLAVGDEVGRCALEDDPAAVVAGAWTEVDDPIGVRHDGLGAPLAARGVLDAEPSLTRVAEPVEQSEQLFNVGEVQAAGRLVEDVDPSF